MPSPATLSAIRRVVLYPSPILRQKCVPVVFGGSDGKQLPHHAAQLAADLALTAKHEDGLGLAAPQVVPPWFSCCL
jgi:peptide deformylase